MPRETLAPTLRAHIEAPWGGEEREQMKRELRAALAVVSASRLGPHPGLCGCHYCWERRRRLTNARERLRRVSAGRARGKGAGR